VKDSLQVVLVAGIFTVLLAQIVVTLREWYVRAADRKRERKGLLRILFAEIDENQSFLEFFERVHRGVMKEEDKQRAYRRHLEEEDIFTEAWKDTRVKLAQLLPSDEFATLAGYYGHLATLKNPPPTKKVGNQTLVFELRPDMARRLFQRGQRAKSIVRRYVPDITTDKITMGEMLEAHRSEQNEEP
jgi:hypothetical protein